MTREFTVIRLQGTPSGNYAIGEDKSGQVGWYDNRGYQVGDEVEEEWEDGCWSDPIEVTVNGQIVETEEQIQQNRIKKDAAHDKWLLARKKEITGI